MITCLIPWGGWIGGAKVLSVLILMEETLSEALTKQPWQDYVRSHGGLWWSIVSSTKILKTILGKSLFLASNSFLLYFRTNIWLFLAMKSVRMNDVFPNWKHPLSSCRDGIHIFHIRDKRPGRLLNKFPCIIKFINQSTYYIRIVGKKIPRVECLHAASYLS